jgi:hypothetical protein
MGVREIETLNKYVTQILFMPLKKIEYHYNQEATVEIILELIITSLIIKKLQRVAECMPGILNLIL